MKLCPRCGETKDEAAFYKDTRRRDGLTSHCRACHRCYNRKNKANPKALRPYSYEELLYRPFEHTLEQLSAVLLAEIWGVDQQTAYKIRDDPWSYRTDEREPLAGEPWLDYEKQNRLRLYLERMVGS